MCTSATDTDADMLKTEAGNQGYTKYMRVVLPR